MCCLFENVVLFFVSSDAGYKGEGKWFRCEGGQHYLEAGYAQGSDISINGDKDSNELKGVMPLNIE